MSTSGRATSEKSGRLTSWPPDFVSRSCPNFRARLLRLTPSFDVYLRGDTSLSHGHSGQTRKEEVHPAICRHIRNVSYLQVVAAGR